MAWNDDFAKGWNDFWSNPVKSIGDAINQHEANGDQYLADYQARPDVQRYYADHAADYEASRPQRANPTANIARILGIDGNSVNTDPYPSHGYTTDPYGTGGRGLADEDPGQPIDPYEVRGQKIRDLMQALHLGNDNSKLVDGAFQGALDAISNARNTAQTNYQASDKAIQNLTAGHVNAIKTEDRNAINSNAAELTGAYNDNYKQAHDTLANDQKAELSARAEMLSRMGITEAGLGTAGQAQGKALERLNTDHSAKMDQANTYKAADLTRNTELASSQAAAGVERQSDLRRQLDGINANLDNSKATVETSKATAKIAATQADQAAYQKQLEFYQQQLQDVQAEKERADNTAYSRAKDQRDYALKANQASSRGGALDYANQAVANSGEDPQQYADAYAQVAAENGFDSRSGQDKVAYFVQKMRGKNGKLNPNNVLKYVMAIENFGTDKGNTPIG